MQTRLNPYLSFKSQARGAMEFYKNVFGGKLVMSTFKESGSADGTNDNNIMHAILEADNGIVLMASDGDMEGGKGNGSISLSGDNEEELKGYWDKLSDGAQITMPMSKAPWGDTFGMLTDKFGVYWLVNISAKK